MTNRYVKRFPTPLIIREIKMETTMSYHLTPVRPAIIKKTKDNTHGQQVEKKELHATGRDVN